MRKRIIIADDHSILVEGLSRLLAEQYDVVGSATNGIELIEQARRLAPEAILIDVAMPQMNGIEAAREIAVALPRTKLIFLTQQVDVNHMRAAFQSGASAYVAKQSSPEELLKALRVVLAGGFYVTPLLGLTELQALRDPRNNPSEFFGAGLTTRQRQVLQLVSEGRAMKEIAATLRISVKTVEFHKNGLMTELGIRTTAELVRYALAQGIVS
jgi:DNA-binding NarL/FixJ family response regulator